MEYRYQFGGQQMVVKLETAGGGYVVTVAGRAYQVTANMARPGELIFELDGQQRCLAYVAVEGAKRWVALSGASVRDIGHTYLLTVPDSSRRAGRGQAAGQAALEAQMPGLVRQVLVAEGQLVARGQALMLLEAMKMEIRVTAPEAGTVRRVLVTVGQPVDRGQALIELGPPPDIPGPG